MKYSEFEDVISSERMRRYVSASANDTKRAMALYRYNIKLSQEMYAIISYFEVSLRNKINKEMKTHFGNDWLRDFVMPGGRFDTDPRVEGTQKIIRKAYEGLVRCHTYNHTKLLAEMEFGVWKFMFNNVQYRLSGRCLLNIFPNKPTSSPRFQYDNAFVFNSLDVVNNMRNRIAHHEPICFGRHGHVDTQNVISCYIRIMQLFQWMDIDADSLLYGVNHLVEVNNKFMKI